ncbi:MAG TPA: hypothetical protein VFS37_16300, partial [Conexibacter sp.]|nr:hypothetical protein [Conexibacter sp.]
SQIGLSATSLTASPISSRASMMRMPRGAAYQPTTTVVSACSAASALPRLRAKRAEDGLERLAPGERLRTALALRWTDL